MGPCELVEKYAEAGDTTGLDCLLNITWACLSVVAHQYPTNFQDPEGIDEYD